MGKLALPELGIGIKNMKDNKSPGPDGFTVEFFKFFWTDLATMVRNSLNYAYRSGSLSVTQKQGVITCIP